MGLLALALVAASVLLGGTGHLVASLVVAFLGGAATYEYMTAHVRRR